LLVDFIRQCYYWKLRGKLYENNCGYPSL
jgi:hypothetical protein